MSEMVLAALIGAIATIGAVVLAHILGRRKSGHPTASQQTSVTAFPPHADATSERPFTPTPTQAPSAPARETFGGLPQPIPVLRVVADPKLAEEIEEIFNAVDPSAPLGGIGRRGRAL
jgi:hypothetical protein